jgi:hypothetical protein
MPQGWSQYIRYKTLNFQIIMVKHNHSRHIFHKYKHDEGTYTNEADYNPQWQKETISHQETHHPNEA